MTEKEIASYHSAFTIDDNDIENFFIAALRSIQTLLLDKSLNISQGTYKLEVILKQIE